MSQKLKILFVDDEPHVLEALLQLFDDRYDAHGANGGAEAIEFAKRNPDLAIVVSDQRMPQMKGIDVLKAIKEIRPDAIRILLTGYADADAILDSVNVGEVFRYVKKPWNAEQLREVISLAAMTYSTRKKAKEVVAQKPAEPSVSCLPHDSLSLAMEQLLKQKAIEENFFAKLSDAHRADAIDEIFERAFLGKSGKPKILVVDDEQGTLEALWQLLSDDYEVIACQSADEALKLLRQDSFVTLLLTDQRMPKKSGADLLVESRELAPLVPKILITAYTDVEDVIRLINEGQIFRYIQKPWHPDKLRETVAEAVMLYKSQIMSQLASRKEGAQKTDGGSEQTAKRDASPTSPSDALAKLKALSELVKKTS
ncbi:MAG: response regulator [Chloroherpetonaceae bacterium]|nr:response regulator [Chloroherpetonaceae bacterium]MDW8438138.1 response regulator [Chloroherpetonaceae bacterium]